MLCTLQLPRFRNVGRMDNFGIPRTAFCAMTEDYMGQQRGDPELLPSMTTYLPPTPGTWAGRLTAWQDKAYSKDVERVNAFHPEAPEKRIKNPKNLEPFVLPANHSHHPPRQPQG